MAEPNRDTIENIAYRCARTVHNEFKGDLAACFSSLEKTLREFVDSAIKTHRLTCDTNKRVEAVERLIDQGHGAWKAVAIIFGVLAVVAPIAVTVVLHYLK